MDELKDSAEELIKMMMAMMMIVCFCFCIKMCYYLKCETVGTTHTHILIS